jgi:hypothetical protein
MLLRQLERVPSTLTIPTFQPEQTLIGTETDALVVPGFVSAVERNNGDDRYRDYRWARSNATAVAEEPMFTMETARSSL